MEHPDGGEDEQIKILQAMEGQIPQEGFRRLAYSTSHLNVLKAMIETWEEAAHPPHRCLEMAREMFERSRAQVAEDLTTARTEFQNLQVQLKNAGLEKEAAKAQDAIGRINAALAAKQAPAELLNGIDDLYGALLSPLAFRR